MDNENTGKEVVAQTKQERKVAYISDTFKIKDTVEHLHHMMKEVTQTEVNASNVNAACNCVANLVDVIDMTIKASKFLDEGK